MNTPGSVFIMDVSKSSSSRSPTRLTQYLHNVVTWMHDLSELNPETISLLHRFGDEILLVARGFETAYVLAFYLKATWAFPEHPPYFGVGYGDLVTDFPHSIDLETWNSPIVKLARRSVDKLKNEKHTHRQWLLFNQGSDTNDGINSLLNEYALIQDRFFKLQTDADHLASALYTIDHLQERIARVLKKNSSTISRQIRKSNIDVLIATKDRVVITLRNLMDTQIQQIDETHLSPILEPKIFEAQVKNELKKRIDMILNNMIRSDK